MKPRKFLLILNTTFISLINGLLISGQEAEPKSYFLQVKTRLILPGSSDKITTFSIERDSFSQMIFDNEAILVFVL
ncbi:hypothetical protein D3C75_241900 [compost metagenome]